MHAINALIIQGDFFLTQPAHELFLWRLYKVKIKAFESSKNP